MRFKKVYIEITNTCNFSCSFCFQSNRPLALMQVEQFSHIIQQIRPFTNHIYLHVLGEPLLHPLLSEILKICKNANLLVNITTNGSLLAESLHVLKWNKVRQINVSLHDADENIASEALDVYFDQVCNSSQELSHTTVINFRLWNIGAHAIAFNNEAIARLSAYFGVEIPDETYFNTSRNFQLTQNVFLQKAMRFEWPDNETIRNQNQKKCYALRDHVAILVDGTVVPCCIDAGGCMKLGNVFAHDFEGIINSDRALKIQQGFKHRKIVEPLCKSCGFVI